MTHVTLDPKAATDDANKAGRTALDPWPPAEPATRRVLIAVAVIGVVGDAALRSDVVSYAGGSAAVVGSIALLATGRFRTRQSQALVVASGLFGIWLGLRTSPWLIPFDVFAVGLLLVLAAFVARSGNIFDLTPLAFARRGGESSIECFDVPGFLVAPTRGSRLGVIARGVGIAAPILAAVIALLASADRVFASLIGFDRLDATDVGAHVTYFIMAVLAAGAVVRVASSEVPLAGARPRRAIGEAEASVVLIALSAVLAVFGLAQLVDLVDAEDSVIGVEHAEYARSGFFQLLFVAAIVVLVVLGARAIAHPFGSVGGGRLRRFGVATCTLTLPVVAVSVVRLARYQDEFGLTMLRLYSTVAAVVIGVLLVLVALALGGVGGGRSWLPGAFVTVGLVALFGLNVANPEAIVARVNLERDDPIVAVDGRYLSALSDDAIPTIVARLDRLDGPGRTVLVTELCADRSRPSRGLAGHRSRGQADDALSALCSPLPFTPEIRG